MDRVLVTGAAGFIGSQLAERLLNLGYEVVGVDSFTSYYARERKLRNLSRATKEKAFQLIEADLLELNLEDLLQDVSSVVHLAAEPEVRASWGDNFSRYLERNVRATQRLLGSPPAAESRAVCLCLIVLGLRIGGRRTGERGFAAVSCLALWAEQVGR